MNRQVFYQVHRIINDKIEIVLIPCDYDSFVEFANSIDPDKFEIVYDGWYGNNLMFQLRPINSVVRWK